MYAIVQAGGRQVRMAANTVVRVDRLDVPVGETVQFDQVLALHDDQRLQVGTPLIAGARVVGKAVAQGKDRKVRVFKYKRKKHYRRTRGHRQHHTLVQVLKIEA